MGVYSRPGGFNGRKRKREGDRKIMKKWDH
jgi:hypothetical protein